MNFDHDKGFTGIRNLGNTCFLNSCIQILSHTHELNRIVSSHEHGGGGDEAALLSKEYIDLIALMWRQNGIITPKRFLFIVHQVARAKNRELFTGFAQNDATEFLQFIMDCLESAVGPDINRLFYGKLVSTICSMHETPTIMSKQTEPFFILNVPIPAVPTAAEAAPPPTINDCISKFTACEVLQGENKWYNENTKEYEDVLKKYDFEELPPILVITLKRFHHIHKNECFVLFGEFLEFCEGGDEPVRYELYGVCNHFGNAFFGHYTAFVKHASGSGGWIHFNDHMVENVADFSKVVSPHAYCLFYRKV